MNDVKVGDVVWYIGQDGPIMATVKSVEGETVWLRTPGLYGTLGLCRKYLYTSKAEADGRLRELEREGGGG